MSESSTTATAAVTAVEDILANGQSSTIGDISVSKTAVSAAYDILKQERDESARKDGRRPLFRGFNLSTMGAG